MAHDAGAGTVFTLVGVRLASTAVAVGLLLVPVVAGRPTGFPVSRKVVGITFLTGLGDTGGNVFFIIASGVGALSVTVVLASLYPVSTALLARIVLGERLSRVRVAGAGARRGGGRAHQRRRPGRLSHPGRGRRPVRIAVSREPLI